MPSTVRVVVATHPHTRSSSPTGATHVAGVLAAVTRPPGGRVRPGRGSGEPCATIPRRAPTAPAACRGARSCSSDRRERGSRQCPRRRPSAGPGDRCAERCPRIPRWRCSTGSGARRAASIGATARAITSASASSSAAVCVLPSVSKCAAASSRSLGRHRCALTDRSPTHHATSPETWKPSAAAIAASASAASGASRSCTATVRLDSAPPGPPTRGRATPCSLSQSHWDERAG
jgi:hypothetical protein